MYVLSRAMILQLANNERLQIAIPVVGLSLSHVLFKGTRNVLAHLVYYWVGPTRTNGPYDNHVECAPYWTPYPRTTTIIKLTPTATGIPF